MNYLIEVSESIYKYLLRISKDRSFEKTVEDIIKKEKRKESPQTFPSMKPIWYSFYPDYIWSGMDGKHLLELQKKIISSLKNSGNEDPKEAEVVQILGIIMHNLPEWYKGKGVAIINSKYNDIVNEIKRTKSTRQEKSKYINSILNKYTE